MNWTGIGTQLVISSYSFQIQTKTKHRAVQWGQRQSRKNAMSRFWKSFNSPVTCCSLWVLIQWPTSAPQPLVNVFLGDARVFLLTRDCDWWWMGLARRITHLKTHVHPSNQHHISLSLFVSSFCTRKRDNEVWVICQMIVIIELTSIYSLSTFAKPQTTDRLLPQANAVMRL